MNGPLFREKLLLSNTCICGFSLEWVKSKIYRHFIYVNIFLGDLTDDEKRPKKKRKRIKKNKDGSGSGSDDEEKASGSGSGSGDEKESPTKGGRKDIRKIIKDKKLTKSTKTAQQSETDRRKRIADKQALFNELVEIKENAVVEALPLDIHPDSKEILLTVAPSLCRKLKPHQARGKFILGLFLGLFMKSLKKQNTFLYNFKMSKISFNY